MMAGNVIGNLKFPKIADLLRIYNISATKRLSQNFILNQELIGQMVDLVKPDGCIVCDVGAGPGNFSVGFINKNALRAHSIEIDGRFLPILNKLKLKSYDKLFIHHSDIMKFNILKVFDGCSPSLWESDIKPNVRIFGNLPYQISVGLLIQWLEAMSCKSGFFSVGRVPFYLTFQKEVAHKLVAPIGSPFRSRLSVMTQNYCDVKILMNLKNDMFVPIPKIDSCFVELIPKITPDINCPFVLLSQMARAIYSSRNQQLSNSLKFLFPDKHHLIDELLDYSVVDKSMKSYDVDNDTMSRLVNGLKFICDKYTLSYKILPMKDPPKISY